jgi:hypoxanthine phosphoribosyltransferase
MPKVPVKIVSWDEIVEWSKGLAQKISESGYKPDAIVAVARGGYVPARLLCDFLDINDLLSVQSQHWVEAARAAEKAILKYPYTVDMSGKKLLLVDDIVDTGDTLLLAKDFIVKNWRPDDVKIAVLQWISPVAKFKPDYYHIEVKDWTWFQYPWTRLEDLQQFIARILKEDERLKNKEKIQLEQLKTVFIEWYGVKPEDFGWYWNYALEKLQEKGVLKLE